MTESNLYTNLFNFLPHIAFILTETTPDLHSQKGPLLAYARPRESEGRALYRL